MKRLATLLVGVIFSLLGLLWFLQGSDIVHMQPILCFANCQPLIGKSLTWQIIGVVVLIVGLVIASKSIRRKGTSEKI